MLINLKTISSDNRSKQILKLFLFLIVFLILPNFVLAAQSPTGRNPKIIWTADRQDVWDRMVSENNLWWQYLKSGADATSTVGEKYGDIGQWATMAYQFTGDTAYADKAWSKIDPYISTLTPPAGGRNTTREYFVQYVQLYDWLYPALTVEQRNKFIAFLNYWADLTLNNVDGVSWGTRTSDSDETTGHYLGLALLDITTAPENPRAGTFLSSTWIDGGVTTKNVGGLVSTGADNQTMRNAISQFATKASGGVWIESEEYNLGTLKFLMCGVEGLKTATGVDYFPEISTLYPDFARGLFHYMTPDTSDVYQWGDIERPHDLWLYHLLPTVSILAGLNQNESSIGPYMQKLTEELKVKNGNTTVDPGFLPLLNPFAKSSNWRTTDIPKYYYADGLGQSLFRTGWGSDDSFLGVMMQNRVEVDHENFYFGDFQFYSDGEWVFTHPLTYGGGSYNNSQYNFNGATFSGLGSMMEFEKPIAHEFGQNGKYVYVAGTTGGSFVRNGYWAPPPTFLHEYTRSVFYLPSADKKTDVIITFDRMNSQDPKDLSYFSRYPAGVQTIMSNSLGSKAWIIHMPVEPTISSNAINWTTAGGKNVSIKTLFPENINHTVYDENEVDILTGSIHPGEKKWQVQVVPSQETTWDTFLNILQVTNDDGVIASESIESSDVSAKGGLIHRSGQNDALLMFNAESGPDLPSPAGVGVSSAVYDNSVQTTLETVHLKQVGYAASWVSATSNTDVYLPDLDPTKSWNIKIDNQGYAVLPVSSQGLGQLTVEGVGSHSLILSSENDTIFPNAPSGLNVL